MVNLDINGSKKAVEAPADMPLLWVLRDELGMCGTKFGCGAGLCGACTVHVDGKATKSCVTPVSSLGNKKVTTVEALAGDPVGAAVQPPGSPPTLRSAATARPARSWPPPRCSSASPIRAMLTSKRP
jgi:ferredoxin